jgi:hypothetical protein
MGFTDSKLRESLTSVSIAVNLVKEYIHTRNVANYFTLFFWKEGGCKQFKHVTELKENIFIYLPAITCL